MPIRLPVVLLVLLVGSLSAVADTAELSSGLVLQGTLTTGTVGVETSLGRFDVPAGEIRQLTSLSRSTHALTTRRGDHLVGKLTNRTLSFRSGDGNGFELNPSELASLSRPVTAPSTRPTAVVHTLDGTAVAIASPEPLPFRSNIGLLTLRAEQLDQLLFDGPSQPGHRAVLADGSSLSGFVGTAELLVRPVDPSVTAVTIKVPIGTLREIEFAMAPVAQRDVPQLVLRGGDVLRGSVVGSVGVQTELGAHAIAAETIERITPRVDYPSELSVTLRDGGSLAGPAVAGAHLTCRLACGIEVTVPVSSLESYSRSAAATVLLRATPERSRGLTAPSSGDGEYSLVDRNGMAAWSVPASRYLYLSISDGSRPWPAHMGADLEVDYFDGGGPPSDFHVEYDSTDGTQPLNGAYKGHPNLVHLSGSNQWRTARFHIPDPRFAGTQNLHSDLRVHHGGVTPLLIRAVRLQSATTAP
jgi:hypothetical protein